jgi:hypothetical protein
MARIDKRELADVPPHCTNRERGRHLRHLLQSKGIDASRLYKIEYFPHRRCWLLTQEEEPERLAPGEMAPTPAADELFYLQAWAEFQRTLVAAHAALAARSPYLASLGGRYELPQKPREMTPADLVEQLGGSGKEEPRIHFDGEGGWQKP